MFFLIVKKIEAATVNAVSDAKKIFFFIRSVPVVFSITEQIQYHIREPIICYSKVANTAKFLNRTRIFFAIDTFIRGALIFYIDYIYSIIILPCRTAPIKIYMLILFSS